jgi:hypothetical protein
MLFVSELALLLQERGITATINITTDIRKFFFTKLNFNELINKFGCKFNKKSLIKNQAIYLCG